MTLALAASSVVWRVAAQGLGLAALLWLGRRLLELTPHTPRSRERLTRLSALCSGGLIAAYLVLGAVQLSDAAQPAALTAGALLLLLAGALWGPLRDALAGTLLKLGGYLRVGDAIATEQVRGRVDRLSLCAIVLRTAAGETRVPYTHYVRAVVLRQPGASAASAHSFRVRPIAGLSQAQLRSAIRESVLLCHWSCPAQPPELIALDEGAVEVHVAALDADYATEIEAAVRRRLEQLERGRGVERLPRLSQFPAANTQQPGSDAAGRKERPNSR